MTLIARDLDDSLVHVSIKGMFGVCSVSHRNVYPLKGAKSKPLIKNLFQR